MHRRGHGHRDGRGGVIAIRIARGAIDLIVAHAREARPAECCGLLLGNETTISDVARTRNTSDDANRFEIEPEAHITARRQARARGLSVLGFYHSHPHSSPEPSVTDLLEASYPDHLYLIVGLASSTPQIRLFRYRPEPTHRGDDDHRREWVEPSRSGETDRSREWAEPRRGGEADRRRVGGNFVETPFVTAP